MFLTDLSHLGSNVYIRRELIAWGDSVKLRYGSSPENCPYLWSHMSEYVCQMAIAFHGLRLDNCHSTPIHIAEYLLDSARRVNPNLYLIAELFTANENVDNVFVNRLGINSLIREGMSAPDSNDLGRQVYRYGGEPVGGFPPTTVKIRGSGQQVRPLIPSMAHAIFFDMTHDNESPIVKRSPYDPLASTALISMTCAATGSNRGFDELVPHHINVVTEKRIYAKWDEEGIEEGVSYKAGIVSAKLLINQLHEYLGRHGYRHQFVDQVDGNTIAVTRHNPEDHKTVVLIARTAFCKPENSTETGYIHPIKIPGDITEVLFEAQMSGEPEKEFEPSLSVINGYKSFRADVRKSFSIEQSLLIKNAKHKDINEITFINFPPSSVIAFHVQLADTHTKAILSIKNKVAEFDNGGEVVNIVMSLSLVDLNYVLYRCDEEEREDCGGTYQLDSVGRLHYCGLAGVMGFLKDIRTNNDLGHPLCDNLRAGDWLPQYIANRLKRRNSTTPLAQWLAAVFDSLSQIPRYLIPRYFDSIITPLYALCLDIAWSKMSSFVHDGSTLVRYLALASVSLVGEVKSAQLPPLSSKLNTPEICPTIAAGLPHFASGYMRCWGRDTFISLKGLLLLCGRFDEAKWIILGFAGTLRHGLIPNLLDGGRNARYNCRDAVWWWLQSIKDYYNLAPAGLSILDTPVRRLYPADDSPPQLDTEFEQQLRDVMQEALDKHFRGISFTERNAGTQIDAHMAHKGQNFL